MPSGTVTPGNGLLVSTLPISEANVTNLSTDLAALQTGTTGVVRVSTTDVSSAQLKNLQNASVQLLAAPGGRFYYAPIGFILHYRFVTAAYLENVQNDLCIGYGSTVAEVTGAGNLNNPLAISAAVGALFTKTSDTYVLPTISFDPGFAFVYFWPSTAIENKALSLALLPPASLTTGDSTLTIRTFYSLINGAP